MTHPSRKSVSVKGVANLLHNLKPHKATGPDSIPAYFLKTLSADKSLLLSLAYQQQLSA